MVAEMATFLTMKKAKAYLADVTPATLDLTDAINSVCERAYSTGRWPDSVVEFQVSSSDIFKETDEPYDGDYVMYVDADSYDGILGAKVNGTGHRVGSIVDEYRVGGPAGWDKFIDLGYEEASAGTMRRYKLPSGATDSDTIVVLAKKRFTRLYDDSDEIPIRPFAALKAGVLAVNFENENEVEKARMKWEEFYSLLLLDEKQFHGPKRIKMGFKGNYCRSPVSFM